MKSRIQDVMLFLLFLLPLIECILYPNNNSVQISRTSLYFRSPSFSSHCYAPHSGYCESGWTYYNETDACYKNFISATFDSAESLCNTVGGHLTSIHSYKENAFVAELARSGKEVGRADDTTWIGLVRSDHLDRSLPVKWMWTDGTKVDYLQWTPDHPMTDSERRCVLSIKFRSDLIALVELERELWDIKCEGFRMTSKKIKCWERIQKELLKKGHKLSVDDIKIAWKNLRDTYKRNSHRPSGSDAERPWIFSESMRFLDIVKVEGVRFSNLDPTDGEKTSNSVLSVSDLSEERMMEEDSEYLSTTPNQESPPRRLLGQQNSLNDVVEKTSDDSVESSPRRVLGQPIALKDVMEKPSRNSVVQEALEAFKNKLDSDFDNSTNKFNVFGTFVGFFLKDLPEEDALERMRAISEVLFLPKGFALAITPVNPPPA